MPRAKPLAVELGDRVKLLKGKSEGAVGAVIEKKNGGWLKVLTSQGVVSIQGRANVEVLERAGASKENAPPASTAPAVSTAPPASI